MHLEVTILGEWSIKLIAFQIFGVRNEFSDVVYGCGLLLWFVLGTNYISNMWCGLLLWFVLGSNYAVVVGGMINYIIPKVFGKRV